MEYAMFARAAPKPCTCCNRHELRVLQREYEKSKEDFWVYRIPAFKVCGRCDHYNARQRFYRYFGTMLQCMCELPAEMIDVPIKADTVGLIERAIHSSSVGEKGSETRAHGTFIKHLVGLQETEEYKQALCNWAPTAMMAFLLQRKGVTRVYRAATLQPPKLLSSGESGKDSSTASITPKSSATLKPEDSHPDGNEDIEDGRMRATQLEGNEYGEEKRVTGEYYQLDPKVGAHQIGPDLIPTEVFDSTCNNMKAGLAKRVKPLPFKASLGMKRKIDRTVTEIIKKIYTPEAIQKWRENTLLDDCASSKWSGQRWRQAVEEALSETQAEIQQTFQIKQNEALPAKGKAPRPIIQCGDKAQVMMKFPVRCFEDLLFEYFEDASIKHLPKADAMARVAKHLKSDKRGTPVYLVEGDGSAWDSCCGPKIRAMTENRIIKHIIDQLANDSEVPNDWMDAMLADMEKAKLVGKFKGNGVEVTPLQVIIDAIRQSGHGGTSCFNYIINLICWLCIIAKEPWKLIGKSKEGNLHKKYQSPRDNKHYLLKYAFEGDDSALSTTENLNKYAEEIEHIWTTLGFRMKLVFVDKMLTFTGFNFLVDENGPAGPYLPEIPRNISSSSWSCSSELKMKPQKLHQVGAAAMLARAYNFKECGAYSRYFAALGLAHVRKIEDFELGETDAMRLGIQVSPSVKEDLQVLYDAADVMGDDMRKLVEIVADCSREDELRLLQADFGTDPFDTQLARELIPFSVWNPRNFQTARR